MLCITLWKKLPLCWASSAWRRTRVAAPRVPDPIDAPVSSDIGSLLAPAICATNVVRAWLWASTALARAESEVWPDVWSSACFSNSNSTKSAGFATAGEANKPRFCLLWVLGGGIRDLARSEIEGGGLARDWEKVWPRAGADVLLGTAILCSKTLCRAEISVSCLDIVGRTSLRPFMSAAKEVVVTLFGLAPLAEREAFPGALLLGCGPVGRGSSSSSVGV